MKTLTITLKQEIADDDLDVLIDALIDQQGVGSDDMRKLLANDKIVLANIPWNQRRITVSFDVMEIQVTDNEQPT